MVEGSGETVEAGLDWGLSEYGVALKLLKSSSSIS